MAIDLCSLGDFLASAQFGEFKPSPYFEPKTDSLIFYARNERSYSKRLNESLTLFLSLKDKTLVGIEIKGFTRLQALATDVYKVVDNDVPLEILVSFARAPHPSDPDLEQKYEKELRQVGKGITVRCAAPVCA